MVDLLEALVRLLAGLIKLGKFKDFPTWPRAAKSIFVVLILILVTIGLGSIARFTEHAYLPMIFLGIVYGVFGSYPAMKFLGPKIQAALAGFLGGLGMGSLGAKEAAIKSGIQAIAAFIGDLEKTIRGVITPPDQSAQPLPWNYMDTAIVYCIWMTLLTAFLIVAANACFEGSHPEHDGRGGASPPNDSK